MASRAQAGDAATRARLIRAHLPLVIRIARTYENLGLPFLELVSEGNIGLMRAVESYEAENGGRLFDYGHRWISQSIRRSLAARVKTFRLPVNSPLPGGSQAGRFSDNAENL